MNNMKLIRSSYAISTSLMDGPSEVREPTVVVSQSTTAATALA